jgi:hypothetical protein
MPTETKVAHTPGPWRVNGPLYVGVYEERKVLSVSQDKEHPMHIADIEFDSMNRDVQQQLRADAALIAAAPEMYEALKRLTKWYEGNTAANAQSFGESYYSEYLLNGSIGVTKRLRNEAEAAIAKAEGAR